tara:strand:+ start:121 stop:369 length:249 start_codon:yes stop_codon:yes gene_type:complete
MISTFEKEVSNLEQVFWISLEIIYICRQNKLLHNKYVNQLQDPDESDQLLLQAYSPSHLFHPGAKSTNYEMNEKDPCPISLL